MQTANILLSTRRLGCARPREKQALRGKADEEKPATMVGNQATGGSWCHHAPLGKTGEPLAPCRYAQVQGMQRGSCQGHPPLLQLPSSRCCSAVLCRTAAAGQGPGSPVTPIISPQAWGGGSNFAPLFPPVWKVFATRQSCTVTAMKQFSKQNILLLPMSDSCFYLL